MTAHNWADLIAKAAADPQGPLMTSLTEHLAACERAKSWLRAKHYGGVGQAIDVMAAQVPNACGS